MAFTTDYGTIYSTNITPDPETGIGGYSEDDFDRALRSGVRRDGKHLYPAFPYTAFTGMSDEDVSALYAFIMSLTPVKATTPENDLGFPYSQRWALGMWKWRSFDEGRFEPDPEKSAEWNRGAYLVEAVAHCGACHTPTGLGSRDTGPPLLGSPITLAPEPEALINMTLYGAEYPATVPSEHWQESRFWDQMEGFGPKLSDENAAALLTYIRNTWGNDASAITPEQVAAQR